MIEAVKEVLSKEKMPDKGNKKVLIRIASIAAVIVGVLLVVVGGSFFYERSYRGKAYPGVGAGQYKLSGLTAHEIKNGIENFNNRYSREGLVLDVTDAQGQPHQLKFETVVSGDNGVELIRLDGEALAAEALAIGRQHPYPFRLFEPLLLLVRPVELVVPVVVNEVALDDTLRATLSSFEERPHNATVAFTDLAPVTSTIVPEKSGRIFNYREITERIKQQFQSLQFETLAISTELFVPTIGVADVQGIIDRLPDVVGRGDLGLSHIDQATEARRDWVMKPALFAPWIEVARNTENDLVFALKKEAVQEYFNDEVRPFTDTEPADAKFVVEDGKVKEFQGSRSGFELDGEKTFTDLNNAFIARNYESAEIPKTIDISINATLPKITTADVNDLGITAVVGVGYSTFKDSHNNRIKNIAHAVERLNGLLIKPGEEFSANKYAGPYTLENGYLPEAVIKGNEIKNEVGGGMCQIGTTLFRMAMNTGLDITERRNHSLVVSYYADPVNGNPGTDATLYEPILDLKFLNDTGNYLLLQTEIDYAKQLLTFTLWGSPDGRSGSYTHPTVSKWIPAGAPQMIPVKTLKPGVKKCQNAFRGAVASFTYTRTTPQGEIIERVFDSYYRPLPQICQVGVEEATPSDDGAPIDGADPVVEPSPEPVPVQ